MSVISEKVSYSINQKEILNDISFELNQGEIISVIGPNGAGKSTLLSILSGDINPTLGSVLYNGENITDIDIQDRAFTRSVMSQSQQIIFDFSVREIIEMGWIERGDSYFSNDFETAIIDVAKECDLMNLMNRQFNVLSGGEQKRVHYARTLLQLWRPSKSKEPRYMFLDEPTASLDLFFEMKLMNSIKNKSKNGYGILVIIHDLNLAANFSDKILFLNNGHVVSFGEPSSVLNEKDLSEVYKIAMQVDKSNLRITYY